MDNLQHVHLLFPRSGQLLAVQVPTHAVSHVRERNFRNWLAIFEQDRERALQLGERLGYFQDEIAVS